MKEDEKKLFNEILKLQKTPYNNSVGSVYEIVKNLKMNEKRAAYICEKWYTKGWYEYGVNVLFGWLTDEAPKDKF